jgi:hypothetical protein
MERSGPSAGTAGKADKARQGVGSFVVFLFWLIVLGYPAVQMGLLEALRASTDSLKGGNSWLVIAPMFIPMLYVLYKFQHSEYKLGAHVRFPVRQLSHFWFLSVRALAALGAFIPFSLLLNLLPESAMLALIPALLVYSFVLLTRQTIRVSAAEKTVSALYHSIKAGERSVRLRLCEPEALEELDALDERLGELTWYQVAELIEEEDRFRYVVQSIRNKVSHREEVTIGINGRRVLRVS